MTKYYSKTNKQEDLIPGNSYHIYNKAIGKDKLFTSDNDYYYFLQKLSRYILPVADIISYCLVPNHFHLLINIKEFESLRNNMSSKYSETPNVYLSQVFSNFFNSYTKSFNKAHRRVGRLFLYSFRRILVEDDDYLIYLINYIHRNPIHHGISKSFTEWKYSSYQAIISKNETNVNRNIVLALFGSTEEFVTYHNENITKSGFNKYLLE